MGKLKVYTEEQIKQNRSKQNKVYYNRVLAKQTDKKRFNKSLEIIERYLLGVEKLNKTNPEKITVESTKLEELLQKVKSLNLAVNIAENVNKIMDLPAEEIPKNDEQTKAALKPIMINYYPLEEQPPTEECTKALVGKGKAAEPDIYTLGSKTVEDYHNIIILKAGNRHSCVLSKIPCPHLEKYSFAWPLLGKYSTVYIWRGSSFTRQLISCFLVFAGK
jgi:hypothetical protein